MRLAIIVTSILLAVCIPGAAQLKDSTEPTSKFIEVAGDHVVLHKDLQLVLRSRQIIATTTNRVGDVLKFEVIRPVIAGNLVVIAKGAPATGTLANSERAARGGKGGALELHLKSVQLVTGQEVPIISHARFDAADLDPGYAAMRGFGAVLLSSLAKGQEAKIPKGVRIPVWIEDDVTVRNADLIANQPTPQPSRTDAGSIYLFMDRDPAGRTLETKILIGEARYFVISEGAVRLEVPPGEYWIRTGRAAKNDRISKTKLEGFTHITVKGGESYYITCDEDKTDKWNAILRIIPPSEGDEHIERSELLWDYPLSSHTPELLRKLQMQPVRP